MTKKSIGVGVIGCGEIAQIMHLPILKELPGLHIAALCDLSRKVVDRLGDEYGGVARYTDHRQLLADAGVDAVVICTYEHASIVDAAIAAGKHFIVEKPLGFTPQEAKPLVRRLEASGLVGMVGYMKLHDTGYRLGLEQIARIGRPKTIQLHNLAGRFDRYQQLYTQVRGDDVDQALLQQSRDAANASIEVALGPDHAGYRDLYLTLLMLGSHNLSVLRGAFGVATRVDYAAAIGPSHLLSVVRVGDDIPVKVEIAFGAQYEWWDEWILVHGERDEVRIDFKNPYVRNTCATVRVKAAGGEGVTRECRLDAVPDTSFRRQWVHFLDCVENGAAPRSTLQGGLDDLELAVAIIKAMPPRA
ncbi:Oxidoreductase domain protein [Mesorhizobium plurifarium]|uniref:Oxidoreductase domain protein n=1 Tax=Mesorhizobium plurifarium TaxID=69974 RepID=A0A0K2VSX9_MESPL|nr:Oxidoreductase domain protein [Mesorhizobium plurifarium]